MKKFIYEHVTTATTRRVITVHADDEMRASVKASVGGWAEVRDREDVETLLFAPADEKTRVTLLADELTGRMRSDVKLLGSSLTLQKGQIVQLVPATNLPIHGTHAKFFAKPYDGKWADGFLHCDQDSILVTEEDFDFWHGSAAEYPDNDGRV